MKISIATSDLNDWDGHLLVIGIFQGNINDQIQQLDALYEGSLIARIEEREFSAKSGESTTFEFLKGRLKQLTLVGLGPKENCQIEDVIKASAIGARSSMGNKGKLGIIFPWEHLGSSRTAKAVLEASRLGLYRDLRFRSKPDSTLIPQTIELIGLSDSDTTFLNKIDPICSGVELARELVAAPPNTLTPLALAEKALDISKQYGLKAKILEKKDCQTKGMGAFLAVAQGSDLSPKFIHLTYRSNDDVKRKLVMIGKGLTFDSGGYNLKVGAAQIELMKFDMGGSAAVLGAARAIGELKPRNLEVHFIVAACENMVNGSAVHPGDIVKASNGKTIEINNTDAEGRLTLADALVYACNLKPDAIVDLATLTGACVIALGDEIAGLWTGSEKLAKELIDAANYSGEGMWRMPLRNSYKDGLKSILADLKNTGPRAGGSITAALFLKEFVNESIPWAHIDIAGTVWTDKANGENPAGATGYGVRTLVEWACNSTNI